MPTAERRGNSWRFSIVTWKTSKLAALPTKRRSFAHPEWAERLESCLAGIDFIHRAAHGDDPARPNGLGEFVIVREVGRGGMGVVYEAEQTSLKRKVALKVLRFGGVADEEAVRRFRREAETIAKLHHTNIVPIIAVGTEQGVHYYAMQFIDGRGLNDVLAEARREERTIDVKQVVSWGLQAAEALQHAHQRGVVHRDVKPSNLLLDLEGILWLTDFGLAKRDDEVTLTLSGAIMGTPRYMSPEQAESLERPIDHRTDIYSLGATLYELATGEPVFSAPTPHGVLSQILTTEPIPPRRVRDSLPRDLETVVMTCLSKDPSRRYSSAKLLADDLRALQESRPIAARRASLVERAVRTVRKHKKAAGIAAAAMTASVLLMTGAFVAWRWYSEWRMGRLVLSSEGKPLRAQILEADQDESIGEEFDIGKRALVSLPGDRDYRLRVCADGEPSETFRATVNRGVLRSFPVRFESRRLWPVEGLEPVLFRDSIELGGTAVLIEIGQGGGGIPFIRKRDGSARSPGTCRLKTLAPRRFLNSNNHSETCFRKSIPTTLLNCSVPRRPQQ